MNLEQLDTIERQIRSGELSQSQSLSVLETLLEHNFPVMVESMRCAATGHPIKSKAITTSERLRAKRNEIRERVRRLR